MRERKEGKGFVSGTDCITKALVTGGDSMHRKRKNIK